MKRPEEFIRSMLSRVQHRGREEEAIEYIGDACVGCCRLPIVDCDRGQQPMKNEDGKVIVVFNGEIYNHTDLRISLSTHAIVSDCDSEILAHIYEDNQEAPEKMHDSLRGMYAIAIYDEQKKQCVLLRDHIGKKPLFVLESKEIIAFASEMKAFGLPKEYAAFGSEIKHWELLPGETVIIKNGTIERKKPISRWNKHDKIIINDMETAVKELRKIVEEAIYRRLPEDWQAAVLCSGGIDSVVIAYLAQKISKKGIRAYVIGTKEAPDVRAAIAACDILKISLQPVIIDEGALTSVVGEVVYHTESFEPNIVRNSLISYLLFKRIRNDDFRIALCGEGADELFFGYADYQSEPDKHSLMGKLLDDLYRTQLLRVDRTSMAFNVETRAPFLDPEVIDLGCRIAPELKHTEIYGLWQGKAVLRQAFKDDLPWETITRSKATLSYGAGFGDVSMDSKGPIERYAKNILKDEKRRLAQKYPHINLNTFERALYLYYYEQFYEVPDSYSPPSVAVKEIRAKAEL